MVVDSQVSLDKQIRFDNSVLHVTGSLSFDTVMAIFNQSVKLLPKQQAVEVDLSQLAYIDSGGLALLCQWKCCYPELTFIDMPQQFHAIIAASGIGGFISSQ